MTNWFNNMKINFDFLTYINNIKVNFNAITTKFLHLTFQQFRNTYQKSTLSCILLLNTYTMKYSYD